MLRVRGKDRCDDTLPLCRKQCTLDTPKRPSRLRWQAASQTTHLAAPAAAASAAQKEAKPFLPPVPAGTTRSTLKRTVLDSGLRAARGSGRAGCSRASKQAGADTGVAVAMRNAQSEVGMSAACKRRAAPALADGHGVALVDAEAGRDVRRDVAVALLVPAAGAAAVA